MQHLRRAYNASKPLLSLTSFCCGCNASKPSQKTQSLINRQYRTLVGSPQTIPAFTNSFLPHPDNQLHWAANVSGSHHCFVISTGFASQSASRLKQSVTRAKRLAPQHHGSRGSVKTQETDPTSNEAIETIPQDESSVQASQSQASELQVTRYLL